MSQNRWPDYLDHMRQAIADAPSFTGGMTQAGFEQDKRTQHAVVMSLIVLGEAATKVMDQHPTFVEQHKHHGLSALDGAVLRQHSCLLGGGTCIALRYGEYRESVDIDFLVSHAAGYRELRQLLTTSAGLAPISHAQAIQLPIVRKARITQARR